ncbi:putative ABC transport system permease protein [Anaerotaenia torta]|uniref:ABC transporter permease n=1 Tax=Anaerotaenia torta TaxID=433293 RepID=UPI003D24549C
MKFSQACKLAFKSILGSKMRSFLTMLGMIIGVASVITLLGLVTGVTNYIVDTFSDMGTNIISVNVTNTDTRKVDVDDIYEFAEENKDIFTGVTPSLSSRYTVKNGNTSLSTTVLGVGEDYMAINSLELAEGRFIHYADILNRYEACVIGTYVAEELFGGRAAIGDTLKINGKMFKIVGIQEEKADGEANSADDRIYIPYSTAARLSKSSSISSFTFATKNTDYTDRAEELLDNYLYGIMKNEDLYTVTSMTELLDAINEMTAMLSAVLGGIAGISLLVAGIGIMNIMLVSVVERTKEIGIRKSLGAKKRDIMSQFVVEAFTISMLGGLIGVIIGSVATSVLGNAFGIKAAPTTGAILLAFGVSAAIGIGFGYMPANKAARLNPIDALRSE